jgi:hypothetical protein
MSKKMTVSILAVLHGDSDPLAVTETLEAETPDELAEEFAKTLREVADGVREMIK